VVETVVDVIETEGLLARARARGAQLIEGLSALTAGGARVGQVRGRGLMVAVELDAVASAVDAQHRLLERGYLVGRRPHLPVLRIDPPLTVASADLSRFLEACGEVLGS
jgi:4-aminobutyrate aminotransferase-like enzyme